MTFAVCTVAIMPLRAESDDRSEMVNQVLFGETLEVLEQNSNWAYVRLTYDQYQGWVDPKQFIIIDEQEMKNLNSLPQFYSSDLIQFAVNDRNKQIMPLAVGSHLSGLAQKMISIAGHRYTYEGAAVSSKITPARNKIIDNAMIFLNASYLWGGKTPFGIDCSGLTQTVFKLSGIKIPRDASMQAKQGKTVNFITDAFVGDLVFFDNEDGNIIHVGILLGDNKIIHASGKVRIDAIDHQGIFNVDTNSYSHKLRLIKSYID